MSSIPSSMASWRDAAAPPIAKSRYEGLGLSVKPPLGYCSRPCAKCDGKQLLLLDLSSCVVNKHYCRGVWYEFESDASFRSPNSVKHVLTKKAIGTPISLARELFESPWGYSKPVHQLYKNQSDVRTEAVLLSFGTESTNYKLTDGSTMAADMLARPQRGAASAAAFVTQWKGLEVAVASSQLGVGYWNYTLAQLGLFAAEATSQATKVATAVHKLKSDDE